MGGILGQWNYSVPCWVGRCGHYAFVKTRRNVGTGRGRKSPQSKPWTPVNNTVFSASSAMVTRGPLLTRAVNNRKDPGERGEGHVRTLCTFCGTSCKPKTAVKNKVDLKKKKVETTMEKHNRAPDLWQARPEATLVGGHSTFGHIHPYRCHFPCREGRGPRFRESLLRAAQTVRKPDKAFPAGGHEIFTVGPVRGEAPIFTLSDREPR